MTIREHISAYQSEILRGNLMPARAAEILTELSVLRGNITEEIMQREMDYNKVLLDFLDSEKTANRAKIRSMVTPEWEAMKTARNVENVADGMEKILKYMLRVQEREYGSGRNMSV
jgi:hypothetical protein